MSAGGAERAALSVRHVVAPQAQARYEAWIAEASRESRRFPGFQGVTVLRPPPGALDYTVVVHFESEALLQAWVGSAQRRELIARVRPLLSHNESLSAGLGLWFAPALVGARPPRPYKQFLLTFSAIYPLSQAVPAALRWLSADSGLHPAWLQLAATAITVWIMVYLLMPRYVRALAGWLAR
jgi:hypothetical protein